MKVEIKRENFTKHQTLGTLKVIEGDEVIFECKTLELPWKNNKSNESCIPTGEYSIKRRFSGKGEHMHILDVKDRSFVLIHAGNYYTQIRGCVLVGRDYKDINYDGETDVISSRKTLRKLMAFLPDELKLTIS
jgi:hypothetical protein